MYFRKVNIWTPRTGTIHKSARCELARVYVNHSCFGDSGALPEKHRGSVAVKLNLEANICKLPWRPTRHSIRFLQCFESTCWLGDPPASIQPLCLEVRFSLPQRATINEQRSTKDERRKTKDERRKTKEYKVNAK